MTADVTVVEPVAESGVATVTADAGVSDVMADLWVSMTTGAGAALATVDVECDASTVSVEVVLVTGVAVPMTTAFSVATEAFVSAVDFAAAVTPFSVEVAMTTDVTTAAVTADEVAVATSGDGVAMGTADGAEVTAAAAFLVCFRTAALVAVVALGFGDVVLSACFLPLALNTGQYHLYCWSSHTKTEVKHRRLCLPKQRSVSFTLLVFSHKDRGET